MGTGATTARRGTGLAVGRYRMLGRLTSAGGEERFLARDPAPGPAEGTLVELTRTADDRDRDRDGDGDSHVAGDGHRPGAALMESAEALRRAAGPGLPRPLDTVRDDAGRDWLVCPYVPALTCAEAGALMYGGLPATTVRAFGGVLGAALARLHATGTAHGALADDGVLLRGDGPVLTRPRPERGGTPERDLADLADVLGQLASEPLDGAVPPGPGTGTGTGPGPDPSPGTATPSAPVPLPARLVGALARQTERALALEDHVPPPRASSAPAPESTLALGVDTRESADGNGDDTRPTTTPPPARTPARRTLLAGAAGLLAGAGGVAAWVAGRGGTEALTGSGTRGADTAATGRPRVPPGTPPPALWRYDGPAPGTPHRPDDVFTDVGADRVYLVESPYVTALRLSDGRRMWRRDDIGSQVSGLRPLSRSTLVGVRGGRLIGLSTENGRQLWEHRPDLPSGWGQLEIAGTDRDAGIVHLTADDTTGGGGSGGGGSGATRTSVGVRLLAYDPGRSAVRWQLPFTAPRRGNVAFGTLADDRLMLSVGQNDGVELTGLSAADGKRIWRHSHTWTAERLRTRDANAYSDGSSLRLFGSADGRVYGTSFSATGGPRWTTDLRHDKEHPGPEPMRIVGTRELRGGRRTLLLTDSYQTVYAVDPRDGHELWRHQVEPDRTFPPRTDTKPPDTATSTAWAGRPLLVGGRMGATALDSRTGAPLWRFRGADESTVCTTFAAGRLVLIALSGSVYALRLG